MNGLTQPRLARASNERNTRRRWGVPLGALTLVFGLSASCASGPETDQGVETAQVNASLSADPALVISQVYGGGGNGGASLTHDFVELFNRSPLPVSLAGHSLQYTSATGVTLWGESPALITELPSVVLANKGDAGAPGQAEGKDGGTEVVPGEDDGAQGSTRIREIQGRAHVSPLQGKSVANVPGIVTVVRATGFYFQDPEADADDGTSEALFVFTGDAPKVAVGDSILVDGPVSEFRPGCFPSCDASSSAYNGLTTTQIQRPTRLAVLAAGQTLPAPTRIGEGGRAIPQRTIDDDTVGLDVEQGPTTFDPERDGIDFFESLEGMRVQVRNVIATSPTRSFGATSRELSVLSDEGQGAGQRSEGGGIVVAADDFNPERILLSNALVPNLPLVNVGARFPGVIDGVIDYGFGNFKFLFSAPLPSVVASPLQREVTSLPPATASELSIASFNVENLSPLDPAEKFAALAEIVVHNLGAPDLIAVEEIQDNNGPTKDATVDASETYGLLSAAITTAGGPTYDFRDIPPVSNQDGGQPGGNIRVGFMFRSDRGLAFVDRGDALSETPNAVRDVGAPQLAYSPGRIDPQNGAFSDSRKPLAGEFRFAGQTLFVVANHFASKGGDMPLFGRFQPPVLKSAVQRFKQASVVAEFVQQIKAIDPAASVVVLGDLNDFEFADTLNPLKEVGMVSLVETLPPEERYSYVFDGNAQVLDHIMVSETMLPRTLGFDIVHVSSEFVDQVSDHDPSVARLIMSPSARRLRPVFECVAKRDGRQFARFGYYNPNDFRVYLPSNRSGFYPFVEGRPEQHAIFEPGRQRGAFEVPLSRRGPLFWLLDGSIATAWKAWAPRCR